MDGQHLELLRDRLESIDGHITALRDVVEKHVEKDMRYWAKIDEQQAQIGLLKWMGSGVSGSALIAWLYAKFGGH